MVAAHRAFRSKPVYWVSSQSPSLWFSFSFPAQIDGIVDSPSSSLNSLCTLLTALTPSSVPPKNACCNTCSLNTFPIIAQTNACNFSLLTKRSCHPHSPLGPPLATQLISFAVSGSKVSKNFLCTRVSPFLSLLVWEACAPFGEYFLEKSSMPLISAHNPSLISASRKAYSGSEGNSARMRRGEAWSSRARRLGNVSHLSASVFSCQAKGYLNPGGWVAARGRGEVMVR